jgi:uncharacterized protein (TIRG00374 family)
LLLRAVDLNGLGESLRMFDVRLVPLAIALYFGGVWLRSVRWGLLLPHRPSGAELFRVSVIGFAVNNLVPVRVGDLARAVLLSRWCNVAYGTTAASLVVERIFDGLTLAGLLLAVVLVVPAPGYLLGLAVIATAGFGGCAALAAVAAVRPDVLLRISALIVSRLPERIGSRIERLSHSFTYGLSPLRSWRVWPALLVLSTLAWLGQFGLFYVLMLTFPLPASPGLAMLAGAVANFATLVPSSPASVGTFDVILAKVLVDATGASLHAAAAYALVVHTVLFLPVIVLAVLMLWRTDVAPSQLFGMRKVSSTRGI